MQKEINCPHITNYEFGANTVVAVVVEDHPHDYSLLLCPECKREFVGAMEDGFEKTVRTKDIQETRSSKETEGTVS